MTLGYIGLGKMGTNMVLRLLEKKHRVVVYDPNAKAVSAVLKKGAKPAKTISEIAGALKGKKLVWIMVPHKAVDSVLKELVPTLSRGDVVIDGGNSPYKESIRRAKQLKKNGIHFLDVGVSGGPNGARNGACMMIGGERKIFSKLKPLFNDLNVRHGYEYMGTYGAGHFVKMVHNGIEYGMMQAIAEGFDIMKSAKAFKLNLKDVAHVYRHGSVIESRLMDWMESGFKKFGPNLKGVSRKAGQLGEGKWTAKTAHELNVSDTIIHKSVLARVRSQKKPSYQAAIIMTLRNQFGGHDPNPKK